jgi:protein O-GlcNAc transferase
LQNGRAAEARKVCADILAQFPKTSQGWLLAGHAAAQSGDLDAAIGHFSRLLLLTPNSAEAYFYLANVFRAASRIEDAIEAYRRSVALEPAAPGPLVNLCGLLLQAGHAARAVPIARDAVRAAPNQSAAWCNLASALVECGEIAEGLEAARRALSLNPKNVEAHLALGKGLNVLQPGEAARQSFEAALEVEPNSRQALVGLSSLLDKVEELPKAIALLEQAVALDPRDIGPLATLVWLLQRACDWDRFEGRAAQLDKLPFSQGLIPAESPLLSVARSDDLARNLAVAKAWGRQIERRMAGGENWQFVDRRATKDHRIRVGYLSWDFHDHATGHLMRSLFKAHDRSAFEIYAYSYGPDDSSAYRKKIESDCDHFIDIRDWDHTAAARRIHDDRIDVLIDVKGHTRHNRLEICARRPAPVQVTYLAFPGTSGAAFFDYILTDRIVCPPEYQAYYSEKFAYLPHCYQINDQNQKIADGATARSTWGLPNQGVVFCSFNQSYKIEQQRFGAWMNILSNTPGSVLLLLRDNSMSEENLVRAAAAAGIDPARLIFARKVPKPQHLERLRHADLVLDTGTYNGHTTTSDALWAGVPVVTLCGQHFASRVSASILTAIGHSDLITHTLADYEKLAGELASDTVRRENLKQSIWRSRDEAPLFDTAATVSSLECLYREMWRIFQEGCPPRSFGLRPSDAGFTVEALAPG